MIQIIPVRVFPEAATVVQFTGITVVPFESASGQWSLFNDAGVRLATGQVAMTHEQYTNWGVDDNYIMDCFMENLGLTRV